MTPDAPIAGGTHSIIFDLKALTQFSDSGPRAIILAETGAAQIVLLAMHAGQMAQDIETSSQIMAQCLRGRATLRIETSMQSLRAGLVTLIEANTRHTFVASTDCVLLLTLTPSPERHPAHDLLAGITPLVVRTEPG
jgi:quercetin dioxygenase-like cupin family protein